MNWRAISLGILCWLQSVSGSAHGDLHLQIEELTKALRERPHEAALWHKRGELYRAHHDYPRALADYAHAERLDPELAVVALSRGRALYEAGRLHAAERALGVFLVHAPAHPEALLLRARVRASQARHAEAEDDFVAALAHNADPLPDLFLERAQNLARAGRHADALEVLAQGSARLGALVTLDDAALELELTLKLYPAALQRVEAMLARVMRKEHLLARKAHILALAGEAAAARKTREEALAQIATLPEWKQKLASTQKLSHQLQQQLASVAR